MRTVALGLIAIPSLLSAQGVSEAVNTITEEDIRERISILADDSMLGRDTPSPELEKTANYIAGQFYSFGLEPWGNAGSYLQRYPLEETEWDLSRTSLSIGGPMGDTGLVLEPDTDYQLVFGNPTGELSGEAVLLSGSIQSPADLAEMNLGGKAVLFVAPTEDGDFVDGINQSAVAIFQQQPSLVVFVSDRSDAEFEEAAEAWRGRNLRRPGVEPDGPGFAFLEVRDHTIADFLSENGVELALERSDLSHPVTATPLGGAVLTAKFAKRTVNRASAPNVVAMLEGSDPELRSEYIVFSGHMDHVGIGSPNAEGDSIWNGADDNASGTVAVVELAEAFASLDEAPRRSMIFLTVSGEEKGLWGSEYFSNHLPVPAEQIVANLNIDMVGRNWTDTIVVIGKEHSDLGETLNEVGEMHPELNMQPIDDLWPEQSLYTRSDHYNFATKGIPILFFFNGTHEDYHGRDDEVEKIDAEKEMRITRLLFYLGNEIANRDERPEWDPDSYRQIVESH